MLSRKLESSAVMVVSALSRGCSKFTSGSIWKRLIAVTAHTIAIVGRSRHQFCLLLPDWLSPLFADVWEGERLRRPNPLLHGSPSHNGEHDDCHQIGKHLHYISRDHVEHAAQYLGLRDQDVGEAEEVSATQELNRMPSGKYNERQSHPAAACCHTFCPCTEIGDRQKCPCQSSHTRTKQDREITNTEYIPANDIDGAWLLSRGAQGETRARPVEKIPNHRDHQVREIHQRILTEKDLAQSRNVRNPWQSQWRNILADINADKSMSGETGQPVAEQYHCKAGDDMIGSNGDRQESE